ncbi:MAG: 3'(2'),5'-bisphosphate nucleotidase CysQ [Gammaproteobacteria bacterium]|nr:3'(2'),5'-bisphosphate nucleotidase CysQ [Gammaproteobacteria bacterium]
MDIDNHQIEELVKEQVVRQVVDVAKAAGKRILDIYKRDFCIEQKDDNSPLTEADLASHRVIVEELSQLTPNIPLLSEESSKIPWKERQKWETYWLIDPIDGTKEFIKRNGEFTVNIALVHQHRPVLGVVYAPALDLLYFASDEVGAWKQLGDEQPARIYAAKSLDSSKKIKVVGSRSHQSDEFKEYLTRFDDYELVAMGSSLKLCLVAEGAADIYPRLGLTSEWDTAAAHAIVLAAGGQCINYENDKELLYNIKDSLLNPFFVVKG